MQLMLCTKFQQTISSGSGEKVDFSGLAIFSNSDHFFIPDQPEFYHSEALQLCHAVSEIWEPWVQNF